MKNALALFLLIAAPLVASAQGTVLNPRTAQFTVSPDHQAVIRYELRHFRTAGDPSPVRIDNLGKPTPDATGTATATFPALPDDPGLVYVAKVVAITANGEGVSEPSNPFLFGQGAELALDQKVPLTWNALATNGTPVPWPANQLLVWTVEGASAGDPLGAFVVLSPSAVWFVPAKVGNFVVQTSTVYSGTLHQFRLAMIVQ